MYIYLIYEQYLLLLIENKQQYYFYSFNDKLACSTQCASCRFEAGDCAACAGQNRVLTNAMNLLGGVLNANGKQYSSTCICAPGFYDDGTNLNCQPCAS